MRPQIYLVFNIIQLFFILYLILYSLFILFSVLVGTYSLYSQKRKNRLYNFIEHDYYVPLSVIVPAHNEEKTINETIHSLLDIKYRKYEIIVIDDGSTDKTSECVINEFDLKKMIKPIKTEIPTKKEISYYSRTLNGIKISLVIKENGGKADALNVGINHASHPYVVAMDADSILQFDALENIARPILEEKNVLAVGGLVRIANDLNFDGGKITEYHLPKKLLVSMQVLEYDRSFLASRLLLDKFNGNLIISGAFGLFRRDILLAIGGYDSHTIGEDMELVMRIHTYAKNHHMEYSISYTPSAVCWTQAPEKLKDLMNQRRRWHLGLMQSIKKNFKDFRKLSLGSLGIISFRYFLFYELFSPIIEIIGLFSILLGILLNIIDMRSAIILFTTYIFFSVAMTIAAFFSRIHALDIHIKARDIFKAIFIAILEGFTYQPLLFYIRLKTMLFHKKNTGWGSIERKSIHQ